MPKTIGELLEELRTEIGGEAAAKVSGIISDIKSISAQTESDLKVANREAKERRIKLQEMETAADSNKTRIADLEKQINDDTTKQELEGLRGFKADTLKRAKNGLLTQLESISKHANFEKAKPFLQLPEKLDEMTDDQVAHNVAELDKLNALSYFGEVQKSIKTDQSVIENPDGKSEFIEKVKGAKTFAELEALQEQGDTSN